MKNSYQYAGVGFFFVLGVALVWVVFSSLGGAAKGDENGYTIKASFENLLQLRNGDEVRMSGVRIGTVVGTALEEGKAVATLRINNNYGIPRDSVATIAMAGLLGTNFVSIQMGDYGGPTLENGASIATKASFDINKIVAEVGEVSSGISKAVDQIGGMLGGEGDDNLLAEIGKLVRENRQRIGNSLSNIEKISARIANGEGTIGRLVASPEGYDELLATFESIRGAGTEAQTVLENVQKIVAHVESGEGTIGRLIYGNEIADEIQLTVSNIRTFSDKLNDKRSTIGRLLDDDQIFVEFQNVIQKANRTLDTFGDSAPISAVGAAASSLF